MRPLTIGRAFLVGFAGLAIAAIGIIAYGRTESLEMSDILASVVIGTVVGLIEAILVAWYAIRLRRRNAAMPGTVVGAAVVGAVVVALGRGLFPAVMPGIAWMCASFLFFLLPLGVWLNSRR